MKIFIFFISFLCLFSSTTGSEMVAGIVNNTGTYNVYNIINKGSSFEIDLKMYGEQVVEVYSPKPASVKSNNENLVVKSFSYNEKNSMISIIINGVNIQGEKGTLVLEF